MLASKTKQKIIAAGIKMFVLVYYSMQCIPVITTCHSTDKCNLYLTKKKKMMIINRNDFVSRLIVFKIDLNQSSHKGKKLKKRKKVFALIRSRQGSNLCG